MTLSPAGYLLAMATPPARLLYCGDVQTGARRLRDEGHEVIVLADGVSAEQVAAVAVQEDVDVVAVDDAEVGAAAVHGLDDSVVVFWVTSDSARS
jgi:hypothetical protein